MDPLTVGFLGGVAVTEGIKFIYAQAGELIKAWREKRKKSSSDFEVPILSPELLSNGEINSAIAEDDLEQYGKKLYELARQLQPYLGGEADIRGGDQAMLLASNLWEIIRNVYQQDLQFTNNASTFLKDSKLTVEQRVTQLDGLMSGVEASDFVGLPVTEVTQKVGTVGPTGSLTGIRIVRDK